MHRTELHIREYDLRLRTLVMIILSVLVFFFCLVYQLIHQIFVGEMTRVGELAGAIDDGAMYLAHREITVLKPER